MRAEPGKQFLAALGRGEAHVMLTLSATVCRHTGRQNGKKKDKCESDSIVECQMYGHLLHLLSTHPTSIVLLPGSTQRSSSASIQTGELNTLRRTLQQNSDLMLVNVNRKMFNEQDGEANLLVGRRGSR